MSIVPDNKSLTTTTSSSSSSSIITTVASAADIRRRRAELMKKSTDYEALKNRLEQAQAQQESYLDACAEARNTLRATVDLRGAVIVGIVERVFEPNSGGGGGGAQKEATGDSGGGGGGGGGGSSTGPVSRSFEILAQLFFDSEEELNAWLSSDMHRYEQLVSNAPRESPNAADGICYCEAGNNVLHLPRCYPRKDDNRPSDKRLRAPGEVELRTQQHVVMSGPISDMEVVNSGDVVLVLGARARYGKYTPTYSEDPYEERCFLNAGHVRVITNKITNEMLYTQMVLQDTPSDRLEPFHDEYVELDEAHKNDPKLKRKEIHKRYSSRFFLLNLASNEDDALRYQLKGVPVVRISPPGNNVQETDIFRRADPRAPGRTVVYLMCWMGELYISQPNDTTATTTVDSPQQRCFATVDIYHEALQQGLHIYDPNRWVHLGSTIMSLLDMYIFAQIDKKKTLSQSLGPDVDVDFTLALTGSRILCDVGDMLRQYGFECSAAGVLDFLFPEHVCRKDQTASNRRKTIANALHSNNNNNDQTTTTTTPKTSKNKPWVISLSEFPQELQERKSLHSAQITELADVLLNPCYRFYVFCRNPLSSKEELAEYAAATDKAAVDNVLAAYSSGSKDQKKALTGEALNFWTVFQGNLPQGYAYAIYDRNQLLPTTDCGDNNNKKRKEIEAAPDANDDDDDDDAVNKKTKTTDDAAAAHAEEIAFAKENAKSFILDDEEEEEEEE